MSAEIGLSNLFFWIKTIPLLDRTNYSTWKILASTALKSCGLWNIVSGEYVRPEAGRSDPDIDQMKPSNHTDAKVRFLLSMVVSDTQLRYVSHCNTSKEMWDTWSAIYGYPHDCNDLKVQHRLYGYKAKESVEMNENDNNKKGNVNQLCWEHKISSYEEDDFKIHLASVACQNNRVILFFDVDCFEVQLWMRELRQDLIGKDVPVVVINSDQIILSVNYTARSMGVKRREGRRSLRDARLLCQRAGVNLVEIIVPERYGKANTFLTLVEGNLILKAVLSFPKFQNKLSSIKVERSCKDELYIDVTDLSQEKINSFKLLATVNGNSICVPSHREINFLIQRKHHPNNKYDGTAETVMEGRKSQITGRDLRTRIQQTYHPRNIKASHLDELRLVHGAIMAIAIIKHIRIKTGYEVSAGISHSKLLAKLACGLNKPKGISLITKISLQRLGKSIPFQELPGFGGKTGKAIRNFFLKRGQTVESVSDILQATIRDLNYWIEILKQISDADAIAKDLYNTCQFKDESQVTSTVHPDVISTILQIKYSKGCKDSSIFKQGKMNIAHDMANRINYCKKDLGRIATELAVKVDMIKTSGPYVSPHFWRTHDLSVKLRLPQETDQFVSHESIYEFVSDYITNNEFHWDKVLKILLTAQKFLTDKDKNQTNRKFQTVYNTD